jgi:hypothetical protein
MYACACMCVYVCMQVCVYMCVCMLVRKYVFVSVVAEKTKSSLHMPDRSI